MESFFTECDLCYELFETDSGFICTVCSSCRHRMEVEDTPVLEGCVCIHGAADDEDCIECGSVDQA